MNLKVWLLSRHARLSQAFGVGVILISVAALIGWFSESALLKGIHPSYIPMAPNTALAFALLGASIIFISNKSHPLPKFARITTGAAAILVVARISEYLTSLELRADHWIFRFPSDSIGFFRQPVAFRFR